MLCFSKWELFFLKLYMSKMVLTFHNTKKQYENELKGVHHARHTDTLEWANTEPQRLVPACSADMQTPVNYTKLSYLNSY